MFIYAPVLEVEYESVKKRFNIESESWKVSRYMREACACRNKEGSLQ